MSRARNYAAGVLAAASSIVRRSAPADDHKSLTGMDFASEIAETQATWTTDSKDSPPRRLVWMVDMPRRELSRPQQVVDWLVQWGAALGEPASMTLIGSAALLWHAAERGSNVPLPENSMDVDPVTDSDALAWMCYDALIGSEFERIHGWHVNLLPSSVLHELPEGWASRAARRTYDRLTVVVPSPGDILVPKLRRNEPRDRAHAEWARQLGIV